MPPVEQAVFSMDGSDYCGKHWIFMLKTFKTAEGARQFRICYRDLIVAMMHKKTER